MSSISLLQDWLRSNSIRGVLVPSTDAYLSEWTPLHDRRLQWATGFSGSMGQAIILQDSAAVFVDSRYTRQAINERICDGISVIESSYAAVKFPLQSRETLEWIADHFNKGDSIAIDPSLCPFLDVQAFLPWADKRGIEVDLIPHPIDGLWLDRPESTQASVYDYPLAFAGKSTEAKRDAVCNSLRDKGLDAYLVSDPEDLSWLLNVRSDDWPNTPVCLSTALVEANGEVTWFVNEERLTQDLRERLDSYLSIASPENIESVLRQKCRGRTVAANIPRTTYRIGELACGDSAMSANGRGLVDDSTIERMRWRKNSTEVEGARRVHQIDAIAVIRFMAWLDEETGRRTVTEMEAVDKLLSLREERREFRGNSFPTMVASGPSGSMPHYVPTEQTNRALNDHPICYVDSGGHYFGGTTDNTFALALGTPSRMHILAHTLVLKGLMNLAMTRFPKGTIGGQLDTLSRQYLWQHGMDFGHGTGHGVGNCMNVHETIKIASFGDKAIEEGMIFSDEPAFYLDDDFGVRLECHIAVMESDYEGFLEFEVLSFLPIDHRLVDPTLLTATEIEWLHAYHQKSVDLHSADLDEKTNAWLLNILEFYSQLAETA